MVRRFFGTMILSSMKTRPNQLDSFLLCVWYSSGIILCCCRSRHTRVFSKLGSFVVSVISSCRSVEKFFSVSLTACSRFQSSLRIGHFLHQRIVPNLLLVLLGLIGLGPFLRLFHLLSWESSQMMGQVCRFGSVGLGLSGLSPRMDPPSIVQNDRFGVRSLPSFAARFSVGGLLGPSCLVTVVVSPLQFFFHCEGTLVYDKFHLSPVMR